ncbi:hypothetical protein DL771_002255 [Monosporascus sp. 5C6A]|nr:hypothetical protein DL771_002255 [Monosporascus sp. 5C6A]
MVQRILHDAHDTYGTEDIIYTIVNSASYLDQTKLTAIQVQTNTEFLEAFIPCSDEPPVTELTHLAGFLDIFFFGGVLTQRGDELVKIKDASVRPVPWSWNHVQWRRRQTEMPGYTTNSNEGLTRSMTIAIAGVLGGCNYAKKQWWTYWHTR